MLLATFYDEKPSTNMNENVSIKFTAFSFIVFYMNFDFDIFFHVKQTEYPALELDS